MNKPYLLLTFLCLFLSSVLEAQTPKPDPSFGKKGKFYFSNGRYNEVKDIVASGPAHFFVLIESARMDSIRDIDVIILKLSDKGIPDPSFGDKGNVRFDYEGCTISRAGELRILSNGRILVAGDGSATYQPGKTECYLVRLLPDGSIDNSFGNKGTVMIEFGKASYATSLQPINDTTYFLAGSYEQPVASHFDIFPVVGKIDHHGKPDPRFGRTGKIWISFGFIVFSFTSTKHTAGGEIYDILVQDDGKILICGGFIFRYTYEGFIARLHPNGTLDLSFNNKGYLRKDFTPGKLNYVKKMELFDSNTLVFGASSMSDFDSDFYIGRMNLNDFSVSMTNINFNGNHDFFEDLSIVNGEVIVSGRSVLPRNSPLKRKSDLAAFARIPDIKNPDNYTTYTLPLSNFENGIAAHTILNDQLIVGGFSYTSDLHVKDVVISAFRKKKLSLKSTDTSK